MARSDVSAIVLAGGASTRFGRDKLTVELDGRPLVCRPIEAVSHVAADVIVAGGPAGLDEAIAAAAVGDTTVRRVADRDRGKGPLAGLLDGAAATAARWIVVVGGDMPSIRPALLASLLDRARGSDGAVLLAGGWVQPLPAVLERDRAVFVGTTLREQGERSLRRLIEHLDVVAIAEAEWRTLDPVGDSLRDIDTVADLSTPVSPRRAPRTDR